MRNIGALLEHEGEARTYVYASSGDIESIDVLWWEGNYSCDCNRARFWARAAGEPEPENPACGEGEYILLSLHIGPEKEARMTIVDPIDSDNSRKLTLTRFVEVTRGGPYRDGYEATIRDESGNDWDVFRSAESGEEWYSSAFQAPVRSPAALRLLHARVQYIEAHEKLYGYPPEGAFFEEVQVSGPDHHLPGRPWKEEA